MLPPVRLSSRACAAGAVAWSQDHRVALTSEEAVYVAVRHFDSVSCSSAHATCVCGGGGGEDTSLLTAL